MKPVLLIVAGFIGLVCHGQEVVSITYSENFAEAINISTDCSEDDFKVRLSGSETNMLGKLSSADGIITFIPPIPFSIDKTYEVLCGKRLITTFTPAPSNTKSPKVIEIYPTQDTLPENLLKFHIEFSQPMAIGKSYQHISITENGKVIQPFLELEAELWNYDKTVFTLWLDPGRIKRELAPNILEGNPLTKANTYKLLIKQSWKDQQGKTLSKEFTKVFVAGGRDEDLPDVNSWKIETTRKTVLIHFSEPLDYLLIQHSLSLWKDDKLISTKAEIIDNQTIKLVSGTDLIQGKYILKIDPKLEDLAGNNLTRPFDRDLTKDLSKQPTQLPLVIEY